MRAVLLILVFVVAFVGFAVSATPLAAVMDLAGARDLGLKYTRAEGTIWRGVVRGAAAPGQELGDIAVRIAPLSLLVGAPRAELSIEGPAVSGAGVLQASLTGVVTVRDLTVETQIAELTRLQPRIRERGGSANVEVAELSLTRAGCVTASGSVRSDVLTRPAGGSTWTGPPLAGDVTCSDGRLELSLGGADAGARIDAFASVSVAGDAQLAVRVVTEDPELRTLLPILGFEFDDEGFTYERHEAPGGAAGS